MSKNRPTTISADPSAALLRVVDASRLSAADQTIHFVEEHLAEAAALPEARQLADYLGPIVTRLHAERAAFFNVVPVLEAAVAAHELAIEQHKSAAEAHQFGSAEPKEALRLRDDLEIAAQAERVRLREREAAANAVRSALARIVLKDPHRETAAKMVETIEARCIRRETHHDESWTNAAPESLKWEPLFAARVRARAKEAEKAHAKWKASKDFDFRVDPQLLDLERFEGMLGAVRASRAAKRQRLEEELAKLQAATT